MIYCVDFDGTLCIDNEANTGLIMTCRALQAHGLVFNNVIGGKPIADYYIDDKAINPNGGVWHG